MTKKKVKQSSGAVIAADATSRGNHTADNEGHGRVKTADTKRGTASRRSATRSVEAAAEFLAFTIDPRTAQIVKLEGFNAVGTRHDLSENEKAKLTQLSDNTLEQVVERAFEAGLACVLDGVCGPDESHESLEDSELARRLLIPLIERSSAKDLVSRDVLDRAILGTLIDRAVNSSSAREARLAGAR